MKKIATVLVAALLCTCIVAGCGNNGGKASSEASASSVSGAPVSSGTDSEPSGESSADQDNPETTEVSVPVIFESDDLENSTIRFELDDGRPYNTLEEYIQSDAAKRMIAKISGPDSQGILTTKVFAEKGSLIFERKFSKDFNLWLTDDFIENVKKSVEDKKDVFLSLVDQLESCINKKTITVKVRYVDPEDNKLYERVFDNDKNESEPSKEASKESSKAVSQASKKA